MMSFALATFVFILLFHTPLFSHTLFFYRGIIFLVLVTLALFISLKQKMLTVIFFSLTLVFFTLLPVTAERSVSVFLLGRLYEKQTVTSKDLTQSFIDTYVYENGAMEKRFDEQIQTGTIVKTESGLQITAKGKLLVRVYSWISNLFGLSKKNLSM